MERIPNLLPGSKLKVWLYNNRLKDSREIEVVFGQDGNLYAPDYEQHLGWDEVGSTPRQALTIYIDRMKKYLCEVQQEVWRAEKELKQKYPEYPRLTEDEFKEKYPHLPLRYREEDHPPHRLESWERDALKALYSDIETMARGEGRDYYEPK